jgi:hypothetical protein
MDLFAEQVIRNPLIQSVRLWSWRVRVGELCSLLVSRWSVSSVIWSNVVYWQRRLLVCPGSEV